MYFSHLDPVKLAGAFAMAATPCATAAAASAVRKNSEPPSVADLERIANERYNGEMHPYIANIMVMGNIRNARIVLAEFAHREGILHHLHAATSAGSASEPSPHERAIAEAVLSRLPQDWRTGCAVHGVLQPFATMAALVVFVRDAADTPPEISSLLHDCASLCATDGYTRARFVFNVAWEIELLGRGSPIVAARAAERRRRALKPGGDWQYKLG